MQSDHFSSEQKMLIVSNFSPFKARELQNNIENAGGENLKFQKSKVIKIQTVSACTLEDLS